MCVFLRVIYYTVRNASFGVMIRSVCVHEYPPPPSLPCMHQIDVLCLSTSLTTSSTVVALLFQTILPRVNGCFLSIVLWKEHRSPQNNIQGLFKTKLKPSCFSLGKSATEVNGCPAPTSIMERDTLLCVLTESVVFGHCQQGDVTFISFTVKVPWHKYRFNGWLVVSVFAES